MDNILSIPKIVFIVPYRDRIQHKQFFSKYMEFIMEDYKKEDYEIFFIHQSDKQPFNRGAMKNIGFLTIKEKYPFFYKNITFVFNDVDTLPYTKNLLPYETKEGIVKHFYGFTFALGGIFSIKGCDFEKINGFPNLWGWSQEDNIIYRRTIANRLHVDRSTFFKICDNNILQFVDSVKKTISKKEVLDSHEEKYNFGLNDISDINMKIVNEYVHVYNFISESNPTDLHFSSHNLLEKKGTIRITASEKRVLKKNNYDGNISGLRFI